MYDPRILFAVLATAIAVVKGQDLDNDDVPQECRSICDPVIQLENQCDTQFDDDNDDTNSNQQYRDCVCNAPGAESALTACQSCVVLYPNFFIDNDDDDNDQDDNEVEQWLRNCGFPVTTTNQTSLAGSTPSPTQGPAATGVFVGSLTTATYTYTEIDNDDDDDDAPETETRTTVFPVGVWTSGTFTGSYGSLTTSTATYTVQDDDDDDNDSETITRTLVFPVGATPVVPGVNTATQTQSVSYTTGTTTDAQGNTQVVTSPATTFDGAAAIATAGPLLGAGMAVMLAGIGFGI